MICPTCEVLPLGIVRCAFASQTAIPPDAESWRSKLLLQVLRETGEEMKRRRQTLQEVQARHAAEASGDAGSSGGDSASGVHFGKERLRTAGLSG